MDCRRTAHGILRQSLQIGERDEVVLDLRYVCSFVTLGYSSTLIMRESKDGAHLLDLSVLLEAELVVVGKIRELFLGQIDACLRDVVHLVLFQPAIKVVHDLVESRTPYLSCIVHQRHVEQLSFATLIRPSLDIGLLSDTGSNGPIVLVRAEAFDGENRPTTFRRDSGRRPSLLLLLRLGNRTGGRSGSCWIHLRRSGSDRSWVANLFLVGADNLECQYYDQPGPHASMSEFNAFTSDATRHAPLALHEITRQFVDDGNRIFADRVFLDHVVELSSQHGLQKVLSIGNYDAISLDDRVVPRGCRSDLFD